MKTASVVRLDSVLFGLLFFAGCTSVTSRNLVGDQPVTLDPKKWNGAWTDGEEAVMLFWVKDATNGVLEVAVPKITDGGITLEKFEVHIRKTGDWWWANFKEKDDQTFTFMRMAEPDQHLLAWRPEPAAFVERVKSGVLKGELLKDERGKESGSVILEGLNAEDLKAIESGDWRGALDLATPVLVLRRIGPAPKD